MSRDDWPSKSYNGAMMEGLRHHFLPERKIIGYRDAENVSVEECERRKTTVRLNARQRALLAHLESDRALPAPYYSGGYIGEKRAKARLVELGVWRKTWSEPIYEDDAPEASPVE